MLTPQDKADLDEAMVLINGVLDRHDMDLTTAIVSLLCQASNDVRIAEKYLEASGDLPPCAR